MAFSVSQLVSDGGYFGVAALMFVENVFPPIPSEVVMPLAGAAAARGDLTLAGVIVAGTLGSFAGALFWFAIGWWVGTRRLKRWAVRHGRWLTLTPREIEMGERWFARYGGLAVLLGRLVPTVRTFISVPAGMARMGLLAFCAFTFLGTALFTAALAFAGYALSNGAASVEALLEPVSLAVLAGLSLLYIYRVVTFDRDVAPHRDDA